MILNVFGIILTTIGTILSLWIVLVTKTSFVGTAADLDSKNAQFKKEKRLVVFGVILIIIGAVLQIIATILD